MRHSHVSPLRIILAGLLLPFALTACNESPPVQATDSPDERRLQRVEYPAATGAQIEFADSETFFEFNTTDNDLGLQIFLDAEGWHRVGVNDPSSDRIFEVEAKGNLSDLGITELRFESAEPSPEEVLARFPPGEYRFRGETVDGAELVGSSELSHYFAPPAVFSPRDGVVVDPDDLTVEWYAPEAELLEVILESDDSDAVFDVIVEADAGELDIPEQFLEEGVEYKIELLSIHENGNRTIIESTFVVGGEGDEDEDEDDEASAA